MDSWIHLVVGSFAAIGAALALGTGAALLRYHRTGEFPNQAARGGAVSRGMLAGLWLRVLVGVLLAVAGGATLVARGLL